MGFLGARETIWSDVLSEQNLRMDKIQKEIETLQLRLKTLEDHVNELARVLIELSPSPH
jgi:uncharacterized coiled-coil protein SlyX